MSSTAESLHMAQSRFPTTSWSLVVAARRTPEDSGTALAELCSAYWYPLYAYVRRSGYAVEDAQDLTQEFFARMLDKHYLRDADRERGRFRSFLLASLKHFLANEWNRARADKRGGQYVSVALDQTAEEQYRLEAVDYLTPEKIFNRRWALMVLHRTMTRLAEEYAAARKAQLFGRIKNFLTGDSERGEYALIAAELRMSEGALKTAVHRARHRFGDLLRAEVAGTLADPGDIEDEIRHLLKALDLQNQPVNVA